MTQLKNAKLKFEGDKLLLIDAPEKANFIDFKNVDSEGRKRYEEALSKATTWEIKNGEEVKRKIFESLPWKGAYEFSIVNWQPEQGKLYDIPASYIYELETDDGYSEAKFYAILIPQQEVKEETQEMKRESGFYWVQEFGENNSAGIWSIAHWEIGSWWLTGCADTFQDDHFYKIGELLTRR